MHAIFFARVKGHRRRTDADGPSRTATVNDDGDGREWMEWKLARAARSRPSVKLSPALLSLRPEINTYAFISRWQPSFSGCVL